MADDLVEQLRDADAHSQQRIFGSRIFCEAADRIEAQERQIAELRAQRDEALKALVPFAKVAPVFDKAVKPSPRNDDDEVHAWETMALGYVSITVGDFRRAAAIHQRGDGE